MCSYWHNINSIVSLIVYFVLLGNMKSLNAKTDISIFINLRYLRLKLLKNKESK